MPGSLNHSNFAHKNSYSRASVWGIIVVLCLARLYFSPINNPSATLQLTNWDALGYYVFNPATYIYHDDTAMQWVPAIDQKYHVTGGNFYQATQLPNGHVVGKYLNGISYLQLPWFALGHGLAKLFHYPADGFSPPYQWALAWGIIIYVSIALFILRNILLRYYDDVSVAIAMCLLVVASNAIQYISVDGGQSHAYLFVLYVLIIYVSERWHAKANPTWIVTWVIGYIIGLATICRPTELVMCLIPLLWQVSSWRELRNKIKFLYTEKKHGIGLLAGVFLGVCPQLMYWKRITGSWVYDVGSKWDFLQPHGRVLWGFEKGWFIYTPVSILFVIGLLYLQRKPFKQAVIWFSIVNIYIIIAWHIWRYGGSYATRALVQSYPVWALALTAIIDHIRRTRYTWMLYWVGIYLICVNLFQIVQYNTGIIHYDDMNARYYRAIYLNTHPTALDMSLLDATDRIPDISALRAHMLYYTHRQQIWQTSNHTLPLQWQQNDKPQWLEFYLYSSGAKNMWQVNWEVQPLQQKFRYLHPLAKEDNANLHHFFIAIPQTYKEQKIILSLLANHDFTCNIDSVKVISWQKP